MITHTQHLQYQSARLSRDPRFDGLFYVAVKSTGIFCRPICPANLPLEENVEYFPIRQQAIQAGYRPCLRCRPDSAPGSNAWKGKDTTVERGLRLLQHEPHLSISDIAEKLGITERYFHQLLRRHMQLSPKQFKLHSQLLNAKQLLHQTQLSVEDIAQAVGFNSSRSLQTHMRNKLAISPSQIRRNRTIQASEEIQVELSYRPPYDWKGMRDFLSLRAIAPLEQVTEDSYSRYFQSPGETGISRVTATHQGHKNSFSVTLRLTNLNHLVGVISNLRRVLDLDANPLVIHASLRASGLSEDDITQGIRLPGVWSPFEAACRAVVGQQISVSAAIKQLQSIVNALQNSDALEAHSSFPSPAQICALDDNILRMPNARKQTLKQLATLFDNSSPPSPDAIIAVKGVGQWTHNYIRMRGNSEPDVLLDTDLIIARQLKELDLEPNLSAPWRSYLTLQLWQRANAGKQD